MSVLGTFVTSGDVVTAQAELLATAQGTDQSVQNCGALDSATRASWGVFYISVVDLVKAGSSFLTAGADMDQTQSLRAELVKWQQKIGAVCALSLPIYDVQALTPAESAWMQVARYATVGAVVVGGAYAIGKVVEVLPHPLFGKDRK